MEDTASAGASRQSQSAVAEALTGPFSLRLRRREARSLNMVDSVAAMLLIYSAIAFMYFDVFGGVIRWLLPMVGLTLLTYTPTGIGIVALALHVYARISDGRYMIPMVVTMIFIALAVILALLVGRSSSTVLFALYIWVPVFIGMAVAQRNMQDRLIDAMILMFFIAVAGVLISKVIDVPWLNSTYEILGQQKDAAKDWEKEGLQRLPGFSRASFTVSAQIVFGFCALEYRLTQLWQKAVIWLLGMVAIYFTASTGPMLVMLGLPPTYFLIGRIRQTSGIRMRWAALAILTFWLLTVFVGPLLALTYGPTLYPNGVGTGAAYSSFADRVLNTWPNGIDLVDWGNPVRWFTGGGLGSIGAPLGMESKAIPADNLAVYLIVSFGLPAAGFAYMLFRGGLRSIAGGSRGRRNFALVVSLLGIGATAGVIEGVFTMIIFGVVCCLRTNRASREQG